MKAKKLFVALIFSLAVGHLSTAFTQTNAPLSGALKPGPYAVGFRTIYATDQSRTWRTTRKYEARFSPDAGGRPIRISVWYPASGAGKVQARFKDYVSPAGPTDFAELNHIIEMRELTNSSRVPAGRWPDLLATPVGAFLDARQSPGRFPLLLYAGSLDSTSTTYVFVMAEFLASHGYVVATVPLLGPTNEDADQERTAADRERAVQDLEFAWSIMRRQTNVDEAKLGVFAKSLGGIAEVIFAMRNGNVSAVVGLDATYGFKGNEKLLTDLPDFSPRNMRAAFLDVRRDWDDPASVINLSAEHAFHYSDRTFVTVKRMNHFDFDAAAMIAYKFNLPIGPTELVNPGRTRETAARGYQDLCRMVLDFFDEKVKGERNGRQRLQADVAHADGAVLQHEQALTAPPSASEFASIIDKRGFEAATAIVEQYRREVPDEAIVDQDVFSDVGYRLIAEKRFSEAIGIMRLIVYAFPGSAAAADSLADAYSAAGRSDLARAAHQQSVKPLPASAQTGTKTNYEVYAISYGVYPEYPTSSFVVGADKTRKTDAQMMFWLIKGPNNKNILVDAGCYHPNVAQCKGIKDFIKPSDALAKVGLSANDITDIIVSHMHWDHVDGVDLFPNAKVWIQKAEYDYYTGAAWQAGGKHGGIDPGDVVTIVRLNTEGKLNLIDGDDREIMDGVRVYTGGRHTFASQYVGVRTASGTVVVASDNMYLYENLERHAPIAQTFDAESNLKAQDRMRQLASRLDLIVPGHDPQVFVKFPKPGNGVARIQ